MNVNEIFYSIQGEGMSVGRPSIFIRLYGCNLSCWWCDTKYTWLNTQERLDTVTARLPANTIVDPPDLKIYPANENSIKLSVTEMLSKIAEFPCRRIVFTGGEPLLQLNSETGGELLQKLKQDYTIEVETNGTIIPAHWESIDQYNVSPKFKNSLNDDARINDDALFWFANRQDELNPQVCFKFVIDSIADLVEAEEMCQIYDLQNVYLMPQAATQTEYDTKSLWLANVCKKHGFNYGQRLQIPLYNNNKGF